ncbi:hypothetical protein KIW84_014793 [Lathyrus oleraceus]|uniref:Uncharacterized protein n=1 Tax=Pisum sativum TaxID=3888 RepID=A0A9D5GZV7_PEA|nr:hypothetical protein KIW84_014793 [Pisum sativum]
MAPPKKNTGKKPIGESSQGNDIREEIVDDSNMQPSKAKKFKSDVGRRELMKPRYVKFSAFPTNSFNFEELLTASGVKDLVSEVGLIYPEMVKTFYRNINFTQDEFGDLYMESVVNNTEISIGLEDIAKRSGIPNEGDEFRIGYRPSRGYSLESLHHEMMAMKLQRKSNHHQAMRGINKLLKLYRSKPSFEEEGDVEMEEGSGSD